MAVSAEHGNREAEDDAGHGGVHTAGVHQRPGRRGQRQQQPPVVHAALHRQPEQSDGNQGEREWRRREVVGVKDRDDGDREEIVDDGKRQQEGAQRSRQVGGQHGQHRKGERDVGGDGHRPAVDVLRLSGKHVDADVDRRGHDHAADSGRDRQGRAPRITQIPGHELPLEFEPDDEEEDGQQSVGGPFRQRKVQIQCLGPDSELRNRLISGRPRCICPYQCDACGGEQQNAAHRLSPQNLGEPLGLRPRAARQKSQIGWHSPNPSEYVDVVHCRYWLVRGGRWR